MEAPMDLREAIETALRGEIEGRELYKAAAERTSDRRAEKVFNMLAREEDSHFGILKDIAAQQMDGAEVTVPCLPPPGTFEDAESPIFTREFRQAVSEKHFEMSALSIGMKLELESVKAYRDMARTTSRPDLQSLFRELAQWEQGHFEQLRKQVGFLESHYTASYSPFRF
jgi:rubrerythrin